MWFIDFSEFKKPINIIFLVLAITGIIIAVITYLWSQHRAIIYYHSSTIQIVNQKENVPFSVTDSTGERVVENVYATNITVWNSGDLPIEVQNIRRPLNIQLAPNVHILDIKLDYTTNKNISEFLIEGDPKKNGIIQIGWRFFDPKEGFRLRIIYSAKEEVASRIDGVIFGVSEIDDVTPPTRAQMLSFSSLSTRTPGFMQLAISGIFMLIAVLINIYNLLVLRKAQQPVLSQQVKMNRRSRLFMIISMMMAITFEVWATYIVKYPPGPPF